MEKAYKNDEDTRTLQGNRQKKSREKLKPKREKKRQEQRNKEQKDLSLFKKEWITFFGKIFSLFF